MAKGTAHIHTLLNPVTRETAYTAVEAGKPLSEILNVPNDVLMTRNGNEYNDEPLQDEDIVNLVVVPKGSEQGKSIGRNAAVIGATLLAVALAGPLGLTTAQGGLTFGGKLFVAGVNIASRIGANPLHLNETGLK